MKKHFPVIIEQDEDGVFIVECPTLRGCRSYGHTIAEAMTNISEAIEACSEEPETGKATTFIGVRDLEVSLS